MGNLVGAFQNSQGCQPFNKLILDLKTPSGRLTTFHPEQHFEMHLILLQIIKNFYKFVIYNYSFCNEK